MNGWEGLAAAFVGGLLTSASPCALVAAPIALGYVGVAERGRATVWLSALAFVAGMNLALVTLGLAAARLGVLLGALPGSWLVAFGVALAGLGAELFLGKSFARPVLLSRHLRGRGWIGAALLGAATGAFASPCAVPALAAILAVAGSGPAWGASASWGALLLLAFGVGRSPLVLAAGAAPETVTRVARGLTTLEPWLPGRRAFSSLLVLAGVWWVAVGLGLANYA